MGRGSFWSGMAGPICGEWKVRSKVRILGYLDVFRCCCDLPLGDRVIYDAQVIISHPLLGRKSGR